MTTEQLIGILLAAVAAVFARWTALDRERAFYPTILIVIGLLYVLFAVIGGSVRALIAESVIMTVFVAWAVLGFKRTQWLVVAGLAGHGVMDIFHASLVTNPGVPVFWPGFCSAYDIAAAVFLATSLLTVRHGAHYNTARSCGRLGHD